MSNASKSGLGPAHRGYFYQDQATAFVMASSLLGGFDEIVVDRKAVEDDRFDDLVVRCGGRRVLRQFKSSADPAMTFELGDLTTLRRSLRIDHLVESFKRSRADAAAGDDEYRVCATWGAPADPGLLRLLEPVKAESSFPGHPSKTFRLRAEAVWPEGEAASWRPLREAASITQQEFIDFCGSFVIELECPAASMDFSNPGQLETLILDILTCSVGIGRYPNQNRSAADVATRLQQYAARARAGHLTVMPADVERELQLRKDFGSVEQQFPVVAALAVRRRRLRREIVTRLDGGRVIVTGPPGSGKSWELTGLAEDLSAHGFLVARHYCYLEPGDRDVQRRITTRVMFANLIYELTRANPALAGLHRPAYAAGRRELEDLLRKGLEAGIIQRAVLIIDGIDHISRVFAEAAGVARADIDVVDELAALNLPEGVCLVVGSQPGDHLAPLGAGAGHVPMPPWHPGEVAALARRLRVPAALRRAGFTEGVGDFLWQLYERSEGNPLYATFLCRRTLERLAAGGTFDPVADLREAPLTGGDISIYYDYLLRAAEARDVTGPVAELLGLIDFGVTDAELAEMLAPFAHRLRPAIAHLTPVLSPVHGRGGIRIYHESFRRFIKERLRARGGSVEAVLSPVIAWLRGRDFFEDTRAYRVLLPTLRRAGRSAELLASVGADFVSQSVEAGHSRGAIEQNLAVTTYAAAEELDWAALARCMELYKACAVCFEEKLRNHDLHGRAFAAVRGPAALAERLLFEWRPTFGADQGLIFCALCDDAGVIPPWELYLELAAERPEDENRGRDSSWVDYAVAEAQGEARLYGLEAFYGRVVDWLGRIANPNPKYLRGLLRVMAQHGGSSVLCRLLGESILSSEAAALVRLELAHALVTEGEGEEAARTATEAVVGSGSASVAAEGLTLGADQAEAAKRIPPLDDEEVGLEETRGHADVAAVRRWVDGVTIAAATAPARLAEAEAAIRGEGWYKNWLRFVIVIARAEVLASTDQRGAEDAALEAVKALGEDTNPFRGNPRACDLFSVDGIIHETVGRALHLILAPEKFEAALRPLAELALHTTVSLGNSPNGPLEPKDFIDVLRPFVRNEELRGVAFAEMSRQLEFVKRGGQLYEIAADADTLLALAMADAGDADAAARYWRSACVRLCAYAQRGDSSVFDLFESAAALGKVDVARAGRFLAQTQPLANAASAHTDGKVTQYAPASWVGAVAEVDVVAAAYVLGRSFALHGGTVDWRHNEALEKVVDAARGKCTPAFAALLDATFPFAGRADAIGRKLKTIDDLAGEDFDLAWHLLRTLASKAHGSDEAYEQVLRFGESVGIRLPPTVRPAAEANAERGKPLPYYPPDPLDKFRDRPVFPDEASPLEIMASLKTERSLAERAAVVRDRLVNAFGYRLVEMLERDDGDEAIRLLMAFARDAQFWDSEETLAEIGEGLALRGHTRAAAAALSIAYTRSRRGGGREFLGDERHLPWLLRAAGLSREVATRSLAEEVAHLVNQEGYFRGVTRGQIEALASQPETREASFAAWQAFYEVLRHRLPGNEDDHHVFWRYDPGNVPAWSLDEALAFLLLARTCHREASRKVAAVAGVAYAVANFPEVVGRPLRELLKADVPVTSALLILQTLLSAETAPYTVTISVREELEHLCRSGIFGLRVAAQTLLGRAGMTTPDTRAAAAVQADPPPPRKMEAVLSLDFSNRVGFIERVWPEFPGLVAGVFHRAWENTKAYRERSAEQHRASKSDVYDGLPQARLLFWELEVFETIFHEVLEGVRAQLRRTGEWYPGAETDLLEVAMPLTSLHVGRFYSRARRPPFPLPREQHPGVGAAAPLPDEDEYAGWYRCGYFEREVITEGANRATSTVTAMSSVNLAGAPGEGDPARQPIALGDAHAWLERHRLPGLELINPDGVAVGLDFLRDWIVGNVRGRMDGFPLLMLQPYIQSRLGLSPVNPWFNGLELVDEAGEVAVIFRRWEERPAGDWIGEEAGLIQGCDLIVRPDVFLRMREMSEHEPMVVTYVERDGAARR